MEWNHSCSSLKFAYFQAEEQLFPSNKGKQGWRKPSSDNSQFFFRAFHLQMWTQNLADMACDYLCGKNSKPQGRFLHQNWAGRFPLLQTLFSSPPGTGKSIGWCGTLISPSWNPQQLWNSLLILRDIQSSLRPKPELQIPSPGPGSLPGPHSGSVAFSSMLALSILCLANPKLITSLKE